MKKDLLYIFITVLIFVVLLVVWFFGSFALGYASNSNHQKEILYLFLGAILVHFLISAGLYKLMFKSNLTWQYIIVFVLSYVISWVYFYNYS
jgi:hypothetical protein